MSTAHAAESCPAPALCKPLEAAMVRCTNDAHDCDTFLALMKKLGPAYDCVQRDQHGHALSNRPTPAIHRCDYETEDDAFFLLAGLKTPEAQAYFCSPAFETTLGADHSETYHGNPDSPGYCH